MSLISTIWRRWEKEFGERLGDGVLHGPGLRADPLGEERNCRGIKAVGFSQPAAGTGEVADLAWVDHGERQAGAGQGGGDNEFEATGGLEHDEGGRVGPQPRQELVEARTVARDGEGLTRRTEMDVEAVLGDIDADKARRGSGRLIHGPSLRMRAHGHAAAAQATVRVRGKNSGRGATLRDGLYHPRA